MVTHRIFGPVLMILPWGWLSFKRETRPIFERARPMIGHESGREAFWSPASA
jgi:hypothetical protein